MNKSDRWIGVGIGLVLTIVGGTLALRLFDNSWGWSLQVTLWALAVAACITAVILGAVALMVALFS